MTPGIDDYRNWRSLREIDAATGARKGTAFRCFKQLETTLVEGRDYTVLNADRDRDAIAALRTQGRIYASSVNVLLVGATATARIVRAAGSPAAAGDSA